MRHVHRNCVKPCSQSRFSFIHKKFDSFISRRGCPSNIISDNGKNFVSVETKRFVSNIGVNWITNLPLAPWHGGFLRKQLEKNRLKYEELQTVLCEVETILNNRQLTYYYSDNTEQCLTPNHMLFGRTIKLFDPEPIDITHDINFHSKKISNIINHFWIPWRREYLNMLRENHKITSTNKNHPTISLNDVVLIEERKPRSI